jgi:hypothetical protein
VKRLALALPPPAAGTPSLQGKGARRPLILLTRGDGPTWQLSFVPRVGPIGSADTDGLTNSVPLL